MPEQEGALLDVLPEEEVQQPVRDDEMFLVEDIFPSLNVAGREQELTDWFTNDIKRCMRYVNSFDSAWMRWRQIYDLEQVYDLYSDIGGRATFPSGLLCEKTQQAMKRMKRAVYAPTPMFAVDEITAASLDIDTIHRLEHWLDAQCAYEQIPGISMGVVHDQELLWSRGFGHSDLERKTPASPRTIYSICSISKLFTAIAVLQIAVRADAPKDTRAYK